MEFVVERKGYYRENEEEEEEEDDDEDEDGEEIGSSIISKFPFSSSSSKAYNNNDYNYKRRQIGDDDIDEEEVVVGTRSCYINNMNYKKQGGGGIEGREISRDQLGGDHHAQEREHMFDKVVTPSDVGKLNRLVIPKQHAEKYFPLHSSASSSGPEKSGALLDFEDRNGKQWRFRYSYWNSSQSYVMTKGWSRFVKEKKLDAGDIVSFHRSLTTTTIPAAAAAAAAADHEELGGGGGGGGGRPKYRLFIDWRHRSPIQQHIPVIPPPPPPHGASWGYNHHHHQLTQMMNYNQFQPYFDHHRHSYNYGHQRSATLMGAPAAGSNIYYLTPSQPRLINIMGGSNHHDDDDDDQTVINSVPVLLHPMNPPPPPHPPTPTSTSTSTSTNSSSASPKRLRLFGVNMEEHCFPIQTDHHHQQQQQHHVNVGSATSLGTLAGTAPTAHRAVKVASGEGCVAKENGRVDKWI